MVEGKQPTHREFEKHCDCRNRDDCAARTGHIERGLVSFNSVFAAGRQARGPQWSTSRPVLRFGTHWTSLS